MMIASIVLNMQSVSHALQISNDSVNILAFFSKYIQVSNALTQTAEYLSVHLLFVD